LTTFIIVLNTKSLKTPAATPFAVLLLAVKAIHTLSRHQEVVVRLLTVAARWGFCRWGRVCFGGQVVHWRRPVCHLLVEARPLSSGAPSRLEFTSPYS
jgi:hypothetical protein